MNAAIPIHILGSCASRDAFDIPSPNQLQLVDYTARTSLASLACRPGGDTKITNSLNSAFQRRMVERDMKKHFWKRLDNYQSGVLLVDLVDDRFKLRILEDGCAHTVSAEYNKLRKYWSPNTTSLVNHNSPRFNELWLQGFSRLEKALRRAGRLQLFINCVHFISTENEGENGPKGTQLINDYLDSRYAIFRKVFGDAALIEYPAGILETDKDHKWGYAPFHYSEQTYSYLKEQIYARVQV